ncbi:alpha/beta hydrolase [Lysinimonas soli]|uniref:Alpha/beta hydrolase n=1 Tax=Lysinimonas soli TaxID=1074233 RepID=A0ABW0NJD1_9MICO
MSKQQLRLIDQQLRQTSFGGTTIEEQRSAFERMSRGWRVSDRVSVTDEQLAGIPALRVEPLDGKRRGTILYFHGGSWIVGSPRTALGLTSELVARTGMSAFSLDYALAPEHPFPAGIESGVEAYRALLDSGLDPAQIAFAGDSAGGGLSVTTALAARAAGLPLPGAIVAFSGGFDATRSGESMESKADADPLLTRAALEASGSLYLAGQDPDQELLSPATRADLAGFPPMLLQVGSNEVLLDDSTRLAVRAAAAGVDVILDVTADASHVFQALVGVLDEADAALDRAAQFLSARIAA